VASAHNLSPPSISVVMPTFNRRALLPQVVPPLLAGGGADEVVVVVDGCDDGSYELLLELARRNARLRPLLIENRGENGARAAGIEAAVGEVVLLLDDDVRARPGLAARHARRHIAAQGLVVVGFMPPAATGSFTTRLYAREYETVCRGYEREPDAILGNLWAGNISLRREDCLDVLVNAEVPALDYHADRALGLRCLERGLRGVFDRSLFADHLHARALDGFVRDARNQGAAGVVLHRHYPDRLGPHAGPEQFGHGLPWPLGHWLRYCRRPRAAAMSSRTLQQVTRAAGRLHTHRLEELGGRLLRRVEQQRGALGAL
jgi:glycosyltransferase involved in cell wall biosynthesis